MEIKKCFLTNNDCFKKAQKITPKGIVVHSTGANNPYLKRYVQPDDGILGVNQYNNSWNRSGLSVCVHAFIGKDKNGNVRCYQTLPFNYACWGVGRGSKGSYNYNPAYIQFEICEDNLTDKDYFTKAFDVASDFCAYLVKEYNISIDNVISHQEAYKRGYGSNHSDCDHWLKRFGKTMNDFRNDVKRKVGETKPVPQPTGQKFKYKVGDNVIFNGVLYKTANGEGAGQSRTNFKATITKVHTGIKPYNINNGLGWVGESDLKPVTSGITYTVKNGDTLYKIARNHNTTIDYLYNKNKTLIDTENKKRGVDINKKWIYKGQVLKIK